MTDTLEKPGMTGVDEGRVEQVLAALTLEEKAALTVGRDVWTTQPVERLGVPSVWVSDGPTGLRKVSRSQDMTFEGNLPATCFPTASALGASWDVDLVREVGRAIATEAQAVGVQVLLAPGVNLKRSPLCGRNFEYFAEDPILSGEMGAAYVNGLQDNGVGGCLKHLVANESETDRMITSSEVDERTLRELYLRPFELAIGKADPWTLMAAYNRLNGVYCAENGYLLHDIVAEEWGYQGIIMSDWMATNDRAAGVEAGMHLQMPAAPTAASVVAAVQEGRLAESRLDEVVRALLRFAFRADAARKPGTEANYDSHHRLARRVGAESAVLLKNSGVLPIDPQAAGKIALIGLFAKEPRFQGSGSSQVIPVRPVETIHDELKALLGAEATLEYAPGYQSDGETTPELLAAAKELAKGATTAVVIVGLPSAYEEEGRDRKHINLPPGHNALVEAILEAQPHTAVVLINGSAVALPWAERVPALLEGWLGGQASGGAVADVLVGAVNPSGKLAETFPQRLEDTPAFLNFPEDGAGHVRFGEGLYTGYRWYDARKIEPLFPFGYGLSYTTFEYSDLKLSNTDLADGEALTVSLQLRNTGTRAGREVVQVYVHEQQPKLPRPQQELKAFVKVELQPGEQREVMLTLDTRAFALYDPRVGAWSVAGGAFDILVGSSSRDIRLRDTVNVAANKTPRQKLSRYSPIREWLKNPVGQQGLRPALNRWLQRYDNVSLPEGAVQALENGFLADQPVGKLIVFGSLSEEELAQLIAAANAA